MNNHVDSDFYFRWSVPISTRFSLLTPIHRWKHTAIFIRTYYILHIWMCIVYHKKEYEQIHMDLDEEMDGRCRWLLDKYFFLIYRNNI